MPRRLLSDPSRVAVECAIARGEPVSVICKRLGVTAGEVERVWQDLDALNGGPDTVPLALSRQSGGQTCGQPKPPKNRASVDV